MGFDLEGVVRDALAVDGDVALLGEGFEAEGFALEVCEEVDQSVLGSEKEHAHFVEGFRKTAPLAAPSSACIVQES